MNTGVCVSCEVVVTLFEQVLTVYSMLGAYNSGPSPAILADFRLTKRSDNGRHKAFETRIRTSSTDDALESRDSDQLDRLTSCVKRSVNDLQRSGSSGMLNCAQAR
jgi:hypothetical protein